VIGPELRFVLFFFVALFVIGFILPFVIRWIRSRRG
jgi:hypothetical protein